MPIVRFLRVTPTGLDFELFVFVAQLEDRGIVMNDINAAILAKLIAEKIIDPQPAAEIKLRDLGMIAAALSHDRTPPTDADAPPPR